MDIFGAAVIQPAQEHKGKGPEVRMGLAYSGSSM